MFYHVIRKIEKYIAPSKKELKSIYDKCGCAPVVVPSTRKDFMLNSFGWIRNDIQQYLHTNDAALQAAILSNLEDVRKGSDNSNMTVQDLFDTIIPNNVQTPAEIQRFSRILATRFEDKFNRETPVSELVELKNEESGSPKVEVTPEV